MWLALVGIALADTRLVTVTETIDLDGPVALAWTKLATSEGVATIGNVETDPRDPKLILDDRNERFPATADGEPGDWVVVSIDGPHMLKLRWEPAGGDANTEQFLDLSLVNHGSGSTLEATLVYPAGSQGEQRKKEVARELARSLEAFRVTVDGESAEE